SFGIACANGSQNLHFTGSDTNGVLAIRKRIQYPVTVLFNSCVVIAEHNRITTKRIVSTNA
ncbi:hypothetical protein HP234_004443, partial [Salmonella enterica subsp. enterica]|nr:hypothetical protein [Salmonella enterica subsp. enterica]